MSIFFDDSEMKNWKLWEKEGTIVLLRIKTVREREGGRQTDRHRENRANYSPYSTLNLWVADSKATNVIIKSISWA